MKSFFIGVLASLILLPLLSHGETSATVNVIPLPARMEARDGRFEMNARTVIVADEAHWRLAGTLQEMLSPATGFSFSIKTSAPDQNFILLMVMDKLSELGEEGYQLDIKPDRVTVAAFKEAGLFYGMQTLRQLAPTAIYREAQVDGVEWTIPCSQITDLPRYHWRGAMVDVARYYMPREFLKKYIDLLALHKMNTLHLHLVDDQGWRMEIKKYPRLTQVGSIREKSIVGHHNDKPRRYDDRPHGGFYTQDDLRELVAYGKERFVTIVPEIEMPGHAQAAIAAYPELGVSGQPLKVSTEWGVHENIYNPSDQTVAFFKDVLTEVMEVFPSQFIHIGGDEATKTQWEASEEIQARIKELGLKDEAEMQSWFIHQMDEFLTSKGRRLIGWDEILEGGLAPGAAVMSWRGVEGGIAAARAGHDVVMAPTSHTYLDYYQADSKNEPLSIGGLLTLETVYSFDPMPKELTEEEGKHILGVQGQLWTEYIATPQHLEYMSFPRLTALAETGWTPQKQRNFEDFKKRLVSQFERFSILDVKYRPFEGLPKGIIAP